MNTLSTEAYSHISVNPLGKCFGAEIAGVDLSQPLPQTVFDEIEAAFATWSVVVFRNQVLTPDQQLVFARRFGALEVNAFDRYGLEGHPGVLKVSNIHEEGVPQGYADAGSFWHTDMSYTATPPRLTMLYALEIPHDDTGQPLGDTLFASAVAAYDGLDEETQQRIRGLRAVHDFSAKRRGVKKAVVISAAQIAANPPVVHPIARTHPITGRKAVYVTADECTAIEGMDGDEASSLLATLADHVVRPQFQYHHRWQVRDLLMWDNCAVQHVVKRDYEWPDHRRMMLRVTVNGSVPF